ncbi:hypothetical protein PMAYCL1PPCAC_26517, partial [Pristionchus mayeri]
MSEKKMSYNASMTRILILQSMPPLLLVVFPIIFALTAVITQVPLPYSICFLCATLHSPTHSILLIAI